MRAWAGISEKRLANKRFRKTEEAILEVFFEGEENLNVGKLAKRIGVARSTVYIHHRTIKRIVPDYERLILTRYKKVIKDVLRLKRDKIETMLLKTILFVASNKKLFEIVLKNGRFTIFELMLDELKAIIIDVMDITRKQKIIYVVYRSEVVAILGQWSLNGFSGDEIEELVRDIVYLTRTAKTRLGALK